MHACMRTWLKVSCMNGGCLVNFHLQAFPLGFSLSVLFSKMFPWLHSFISFKVLVKGHFSNEAFPEPKIECSLTLALYFQQCLSLPSIVDICSLVYSLPSNVSSSVADAFSTWLTPLSPAPSTAPDTQQAFNQHSLAELKDLISSQAGRVGSNLGNIWNIFARIENVLYK